MTTIVPDSLFGIVEPGFGDYLMFDIDATGRIVNWTGRIVDKEWTFIK